MQMGFGYRDFTYVDFRKNPDAIEKLMFSNEKVKAFGDSEPNVKVLRASAPLLRLRKRALSCCRWKGSQQAETV